MFTKNFDVLMSCLASGNITIANANATTYLDPDNTVVANYSASPTYSQTLFPYQASSGSNYYGNNLGIWARNLVLGELQSGESSVPSESYFDYYLTHPVSFNVVGSYNYPSRSITQENGKWYLNISQTFTNGTGTDRTIAEIGVTTYCYCSTNSYTQNFLMYRAVLPTPVLVEAGGNFVASLKIELPNYRPNKPSA